MLQQIFKNKVIGILLLFLCIIQLGLYSFRADINNIYPKQYQQKLNDFTTSLNNLSLTISKETSISPKSIATIKNEIATSRIAMKKIDFWLRYLDPLAYKKINAPLPVEWETEVFEKYEKPYKRIGAGLTLAELYLNENNINKDSLLQLVQDASTACKIFSADSTTKFIQKPAPFFFCNRLFLLNLATIYTTGFECPNSENILPELLQMLKSVKEINETFEDTYPIYFLSPKYKKLFNEMIAFVEQEPKDANQFNHFLFIKKYVNPLFALNQQMIRDYNVFPKSYNDYTLNNNCISIFDKGLYKAQNGKGIYIAVDDSTVLKEIYEIGKLLFYDPILSENNMRSCASCHKPTQYFNDTSITKNLQFNGIADLKRNTPTLINSVYNHLLMLDGKHITLQNQAKDVITNPIEMNANESKVVENILSCDTYKKTFKKLLKQTPQYNELTLEHITSAITYFYSSFSNATSLFDDAMNNKTSLNDEQIEGFNLFMSKSQCATCHFVPLFNGIKPPFVSSEFEVLGVPSTSNFKSLDTDLGRYEINAAHETYMAFRTGSIRNSSYTQPYMHNGVFKTIDEVINFYDEGGGVGKGLSVNNQTLSSDSLHLTQAEKQKLKTFIKCLDEKIDIDIAPSQLPISKNKQLNNRKVGGIY